MESHELPPRRRRRNVPVWKRAIALMLQFDVIEKPLRKWLFKYGWFVGLHPLPFIVLPLLFTLACASGFLNRIDVYDATYLFTPTNAPSYKELRIVNEKFPQYNGNYQPDKSATQQRQCSVIAKAADGGNILRSAHGKAVEDLNRFIIDSITIEHNGRRYNFSDLCLKTSSGCYENVAVPLVNTMYQNLPDNLTFPVLQLGTNTIYLAGGLGGVYIKPGTNVIASASAWIMVYQLQYFPEDVSEISGLWEQGFHEAMMSYYSPLLETSHFFSQTLNEELKKNAELITPKFVITFTVLISFSVFSSTSLLARSFYVDWVVSKPLLAFCGVLNAGMGVVAAIGLPSLCGYVYNDIVSVMPILIVSICVEYMFLLTSAWRRTSRVHSVEQRLAESTENASVSIFIAMVTGGISFAVGTITTIPAVQIFSAYACLAMFFSMIFQFTFFIGCMAVFGRMEASGRHCMFFVKAVPATESAKANFFQKMFMGGSVPDFRRPDSIENLGVNKMDKFFGDYYAPMLMNSCAKAVVILIFLVYLGFGLYGCLQLREGLKPEDLMVKGSYAIPHYENLEQYFWTYGPQVQVLVNNPPDMSTTEGQVRAMQVASAMANTEHTSGNASIVFFLPMFLNYVERFNYTAALQQKPFLFYRLLKNDFLSLSSFSQWRDDIVWGNPDKGEDPFSITTYRFTIGLKQFSVSNDQQKTLKLLRKTAAQFPEHNVTTYMYFWQYADQYLVILPNTLENVAIALALMVCISAVLIPQPLVAVFVAVAVASIDIGVIGYMTLWGVNLDAISMITIIMSIGFSVDFTAHISYGYVVNKESDSSLRMQSVLGTRSWPIIQGGLSTILGMLALAGLDSYIIVTFFKTVFLVMAIGVIHAIMFLPVLLSIFIRPSACFKLIKVLNESSKSADTGALPLDGMRTVIEPNYKNSFESSMKSLNNVGGPTLPVAASFYLHSTPLAPVPISPVAGPVPTNFYSNRPSNF